MPSYETFEDLPIWKLSRSLAKEIYSVTQQGNFAKDFGLKGQIERAAVSVMSNIAEGFERKTDRDFAQFLNIAKASAGEVRSQLYLAFDIGYLSKSDHVKLNEEFKQLSSQIAGFMKYLNNSST